MLGKSLIYFASNVVNALIPLALLPILTRVLTVEEYGQVGLFQTLVTAYAGIVGLTAAGAAGRKYFDEDVSREDMATYVGAAFQILLLSVVPILLLTVLLAPFGAERLDIPVGWILAAAIVPAFNVLILTRLVQWQVRGEALRYGSLQIGLSALNFVLSIALVIWAGWDGAGRVIGQVAATAAVGLIAVILLKRDALLSFFSWRPGQLKEILAYGLPLVPHTFGLFVLAYADRVIVADMLGLERAGMYIAVVQLAAGAHLVFDAINKAYIPWLYERLAKDVANEKIRIVRMTYAWYVVIALGVALAFVIAPPIFVFIAGEAYAEAAPIVGWIALGQGLSGMYLMVTNYVFYARRTGLLAVTTSISAAVAIGALIVLVERYGMLGAAYAFCIGMTVRFVLTWWAAQWTHPMPWLAALRPRPQAGGEAVS